MVIFFKIATILNWKEPLKYFFCCRAASLGGSGLTQLGFLLKNKFHLVKKFLSLVLGFNLFFRSETLYCIRLNPPKNYELTKQRFCAPLFFPEIQFVFLLVNLSHPPRKTAESHYLGPRAQIGQIAICCQIRNMALLWRLARPVFDRLAKNEGFAYLKSVS